jgi:hypothetical protein
VVGYTFNVRLLHPHPSTDLPARRDSCVPSAYRCSSQAIPELSPLLFGPRENACLAKVRASSLMVESLNEGPKSLSEADVARDLAWRHGRIGFAHAAAARLSAR